MQKVKVYELSKYDPTVKKYKLMIKAHWDTGINYLCVTTHDNYLEYSGSGVLWKKLLKKHPSQIYTYIIYTSDDVEIFNKACEYYSEFFDVVNCDYFANLIPEYGYSRETFEIKHSEQGLENLRKSAKKTGLKAVKDQTGIHNPIYKELRVQWPSNGGRHLIESGNLRGCTTKEWMENNKEIQKINCSNAGKVGGKVVGNMLWWNDGIINKKAYECPEGFVRGMLMSEKKRNQVYGSFCGKTKKEKI